MLETITRLADGTFVYSLTRSADWNLHGMPILALCYFSTNEPHYWGKKFAEE